MGFEKTDWKCRYVSGRDNTLTDFFIPALKESSKYYRVAGYFSSTILSAVASGLAHFIESGETMQLVVGAEFNEEDVKAIKNGIENPTSLIETKLVKTLEGIEDEIIRNRLGVLAWLISEGKLEIKIGFPKISGRLATPPESLFHEKIAIFEDHVGNRMQIEGSENETAAAWTRNREAFSVHRGWVEGESKYVADAMGEFEKLWDNKDEFSEVMSLPEAAKKKLLVFKPKDRPTRDPLEPKPKNTRKPWKCQSNAIGAWEHAGCKGIISMATGSGKTLTSLWAIEKCAPVDSIIVICAPNIVLLKQWREEVPKIFEKRALSCYSGESWKRHIQNFVEYCSESKSGGIILCTNESFSSEIFLNAINSVRAPEKLVFLSDEVHSLGAPKARKALARIKPKYRLGLSATPIRKYDSEGTQAIMEFFGGVVFTYSLKEALDDKILTQYRYFVHPISLSKIELAKYLKLTKKIKRLFAINSARTQSGKEGETDYITNLIMKRAMIRKEAREKIEKTIDLIEDSGAGKRYPKLNRCLIYCSSKRDVEEITKILFSEKSRLALRYTSDEDVRIRDSTLTRFKNEHNSFLVAVDCLDQGVDVPACDSAIILASSKEPRQYIQRRGRVLRKAEGKEIAIIHDFICLPMPIDMMEVELPEIDKEEYKIFAGDLDRIIEFAENSSDHEEVLKSVRAIRDTINRCYMRV